MPPGTYTFFLPHAMICPVVDKWSTTNRNYLVTLAHIVSFLMKLYKNFLWHFKATRKLFVTIQTVQNCFSFQNHFSTAMWKMRKRFYWYLKYIKETNSVRQMLTNAKSHFTIFSNIYRFMTWDHYCFSA